MQPSQSIDVNQQLLDKFVGGQVRSISEASESLGTIQDILFRDSGLPEIPGFKFSVKLPPTVTITTSELYFMDKTRDDPKWERLRAGGNTIDLAEGLPVNMAGDCLEISTLRGYEVVRLIPPESLDIMRLATSDMRENPFL